jgi:tetratricopeptide (TPR) repeat protein
MSPCLNDNTVASLLAGALGDALPEVEAHLRACSSCAERAATARANEISVLSKAVQREWRLPPGMVVADRYLLLERLGAGGMGEVFTAYDPKLDRKVALKLLHPDEQQSAEKLQERLLHEAKALARLAHPNVVAVFDVGALDDQLFVTMELIDGRTLRSWAADQPGWRAILETYRQAGAGLAAAHALGIVHRDFKPDNVLIEKSGRVRVVDFGLARLTASSEPDAELPPADARRTRTGAFLGTPAYMAPEQHLRQPAGPAADQFSFCLVLYEALYGQRPFPGATPEETAQATIAGKLLRPPRNARAPLWIFRILARGLSVAPEERYPSMDALLAELAHDPARTRRTWLSVLALAALAALAVGGLVRTRASRSQICHGSAQKWAGVWDANLRHVVQNAFSASAQPYAEAVLSTVVHTLDRYTAAWTTAHADNCEATRIRGEQSEELMELRMECLESRRQEVRALVELLAHPDAQLIERAVQATSGLPALDECRDAEALRQVLRPPSPQAHARVAAIRTRLAGVSALTRAGRYSEARKLAEAVASDARALGYPPVLAEALIQRADVEVETGAATSAVDTLLAAEAAADAGRYDHARARTFIDLAYALAEKLARPAEALPYCTVARAALVRAGGEPSVEAQLDNVEGTVLGNLGRYEEGLALQKRGLARREQLLGPSDVQVGGSLVSLSNLYRKKGEITAAIANSQRALEIYCETYGPNHPATSAAWNNLGAALEIKGDYRAAASALEKGLAIREATLGPAHPSVGAALSNLGEVYFDLHQLDKARSLLERARAILLQALGPEHVWLAYTENNLAAVFAELGKRDLALAHAERALAIREHAYGDQHPDVAVALTAIGEVHVVTHHYQDAFKPLERALTILGHHPSDPEWQVRARFALARALWETQRDRVRALALAESARGQAREPVRRAEIDAWLAERH